MVAQVRSCTLIIGGERYIGFDCVMATLPGSEAGRAALIAPHPLKTSSASSIP
jgi:hypothetical protein